MSATKKAAAARAAVASGVEAIRRELDDLTRRRKELIERRAAVEAAPVARVDAEESIANLVEALAARVDLPAYMLSHTALTQWRRTWVATGSW